MQMNLDAVGVRRRRVFVLGATAILLFAAVGAYLALTHTSQPSTTGSSVKGSDPGVAQMHTPHPVSVRELLPIRATRDPAEFATEVATALFEWDTASMVTQAQYVDRLVAEADPTGEESPGLVADIATYLPSANAWAELREYRTRQWLTVSSSAVPTLWPQALAEAGPDGLLQGTTAYTIRGLRHRVGVWEGASVASEHDVAFTVFIVCEPSYPTCHLLRLSMLDDPLD